VRAPSQIGLFLALLLGATSSAGAARVGAALAALDGAAIVRGAGRLKVDGTREWRETSTADILPAGITVQAANDQPLEMTLPDGVTVTLDPGALARWMPGGKLPSETNHWTHGYHLLLEQGELEVRMPPSPKGTHAFLVSTSAGTLTDWRGQLHVRVAHDTTSAAIYEGALVVGSNGQGFPVYDGAAIVMRRGINPERSRVIPAPPTWDAKSGGFSLLSSDEPACIDMAWTPVPGATEYRVEVATDPTMVRVIQRTTTREPRFTANSPASGGASAGATAGTSAGRTWVHVRAVSPDGIVGNWSAARPIHSTRYSLPDGAFVARDGAIVLPQGGVVPVSNTEGLQVAYENMTTLSQSFAVPLYWSTLTGPIRMSETSPMRVVHVRDTAIGAEARLVLARRQLKAYVDLGPAHARWPADPLDARVEVRDPSGRIDVTREPVTVEAMLDLTPLPVSWQHDGASWRGRIAPRLIGDSSVVRVVVKDAQGAEIGRGFLELASSDTHAIY
jgi:hypothetical protein